MDNEMVISLLAVIVLSAVILAGDMGCAL